LSFSKENGWQESSVKIHLPAEKAKNALEAEAPEFKVGGIYHRSLVEVIKTAFQDISTQAYHFTLFHLFWKPSPNSPPECIITELYNSNAFLEEHKKVQKQPQEPGCELETAIAAIMLWSDSTHLASFGMASLWPIYAYFRNQSKYAHAKPTSFAAHHLAYIPSVCLLYVPSLSELMHFL
jgi:Plavaka transposase